MTTPKPERRKLDAAPFAAVVGVLYRRGETIANMSRVSGASGDLLHALAMGEREQVTIAAAAKLRRLVQLLPEQREGKEYMTTLVILSGGMDSTVLAYREATRARQLIAVSFNYGQRHLKEIDYARLTTNRLGIEHVVVDLSHLAPLLGGSALTDPAVVVPDGHYAEESMKATVVPNRNAIMLSVATGIAVARNADRVAFGVHAGDHYVYPDCRPEFVVAMDEAVRLGTQGFARRGFHVAAPFIRATKSEIARIGEVLSVQWDETWSCYKGGHLHCGSCGTCYERREAFTDAGLTDPTEYVREPAFADPRTG